jgi:hypothetical protein
MTGAADVQLDGILRLQAGLRAYADGSQSVARAVAAAEAAVQGRIAAVIAERASELASAEHALQQCLAARKGGCGALSDRVAQMRSRLESARSAAQLAQGAAAAFRPAAIRHARETQALISDGLHRTSLNASDVATYASSGSLAEAGPAAASGGGAAPRASAPPAAGPETQLPYFPEGWAMVPLSSIDTSENPVRGPQDFGKGYTPQDLQWAINALHEVVLPAMAAGLGRDYFADRDTAEGRYGTRSYSDTYNGFFDRSQCIALSRDSTGRFTVDNGRHRIWVAQQMSEAWVIARVSS